MSAPYTDNFLTSHISYFNDTMCRNELSGKTVNYGSGEVYYPESDCKNLFWRLPSYFEDFPACYLNLIF